MLSKKFSCNWFSFGIWRKQTFRFWPVWVSYLAIWLLSAPQMLGSYYGYGETMGLDATVYEFGRGLMQSLPAVCGLMAVYAAIAAMAVYSYLYQHRSVSLFHSLPVRRETLFATNFITGLSFLVVPNLILTLYFGLLQMMRGATGDLVPLLTWFAVTTLMAIFFFGLATLCATATATVLMLPVLYGIFNFLFVVVESVLRWLASMFLWGVTQGQLQYIRWSPMAYIMQNGFRTNGDECVEYTEMGMQIKSYLRFEDWGYVLLVALAGLLFAAAALWLYRRWQSEAAGDLIAFSFLRPVFTYAWAAGCSLMLGSFLFILLGEGSILGYLFGYDGMDNGAVSNAGNLIFVICLLLGGTVGYFSANMLHKKSFRVFTKRDLRGYGAFVLALLALVLCIKADVFDIEGWTPDADEVECVWMDRIKLQGDEIPAAIRVHQAILSQREVLEEQLLTDVDYESEYFETLTIRYQLKSGKEVTRQYSMLVNKSIVKDPTTAVGQLFALTESREKRLERSKLKEFGTFWNAKLYVTHTPKDPAVYEDLSFYVQEADELAGLQAALLQDVEEGAIGVGTMFERLYSRKWNEDKYETGEVCWADLSIQNRSGEFLEFYITEDCPNTLAWVKTQLAAYLAQKTDPTVQDKAAGVN